MLLPDGRVDGYAVNIIIEKLIDQVDDQVWYTGILEPIVSFCRDPDVAIPTIEQAYTNVDIIQSPLITTMVWYV